MSKKNRQSRRIDQPQEIPMTPMIDVVFLLLIYFLVTYDPVDIMTHLDVFTPSPEAQKEKPEQPPNLIRIVIFPDGFTINDKEIDQAGMDRILHKLGSIDPNQTIMIMATAKSPHGKLIEVLDLCAKSGLRNLSVLSGN